MMAVESSDPKTEPDRTEPNHSTKQEPESIIKCEPKIEHKMATDPMENEYSIHS